MSEVIRAGIQHLTFSHLTYIPIYWRCRCLPPNTFVIRDARLLDAASSCLTQIKTNFLINQQYLERLLLLREIIKERKKTSGPCLSCAMPKTQRGDGGSNIYRSCGKKAIPLTVILRWKIHVQVDLLFYFYKHISSFINAGAVFLRFN